MVCFYGVHNQCDVTGADWSMHGVSHKEAVDKLRDFFAQSTHEGPRFDTYILYYSGPTLPDSGDWALTNGGSLALSDLTQLWRDANVSDSSRLVVIVDSAHAHHWTRPVWRNTSDMIALQTYRPGRSKLAADDDVRFTEYYCQQLATQAPGTDAQPASSRCRPAYAVSRRWASFAFHAPSTADTNAYWADVVPRPLHACMRPILALVGVNCGRFVPLGALNRWLRACRLRIWPPALLDTQHGFRLVRG